MIKNNLKFIFGSLLISSVGFSACVSTDIEQPGQPIKEYGDQLVINLQTPKHPATRADNTHKLRYTAKVYHLLNGTDIDLSSVQRKEIIDNGNSQENNVIVFKVDPDEKYRVFIFADYIPVESNLNDRGEYTDYYYNTHINSDYIAMNVTPGNTSSSKIDRAFFNNDYYDCFSYSDTVHKTILKKELNCTLQRATAKIRVIETSENKNNFANLTFQAVPFVSQFNLTTGECMLSQSSTQGLSSIQLNEFGNDDENELFYFYTLAGGKNSDTKHLERLKFTVTNLQGKTTETEIEAQKIPIQKNFITTIKGNFVAEEVQEPVLDLGDLILYMDVNNDWEGEQTFNPN
ncbi:MAG: hypothetical protein J1E82_09475 [Muribaculaceae bacterium]|nr:hypothetical protein [Muribaculaceae bacterium]